MLNIYVVSLKKDVKKRELISKTLEGFGLKYRFIDAVYGKDLSEDVLNSYRVKSVGKIHDRGYSMTPGEIGCTLSHINAYKDMLDNDLSWACILEDDVILDERFKDFIECFNSSSLDPKSLYLLGGQNGLKERFIVKSLKNITTVGTEKFNKTIKSEQYIYRTCCYLISSCLAKKLIKLSQTSFILADDWNYLVKNSFIKNIYLSGFVEHPIDLSESLLQNERDIALLSKISESANNKSSFYKRLKATLKWRVRLSALKIYRYVEKSETINKF